MKTTQLTTNHQLNAHLSSLMAHAKLTSFGVPTDLASKTLFEVEANPSSQSTFERLTEDLNVVH